MSLRPAAASSGPVLAMASFSILADMLKQIVFPHIAVRSLVPVGSDVHDFKPTASEAKSLADVNYLAANGLGLDSWVDRLRTATGFRGRFGIASAGVRPRLLGKLPDPHAWQDPRNGVKYVRNLAAMLGQAADDSAVARYIEQIESLDAWIAAQIASVPANARRIVTTHDAFGYYGERYGVAFLAAQGVSGVTEPSAKAVATLIAQIKREKIRAVFAENLMDPRFADVLARETGAALGDTVYPDTLSSADGPAASYLDMLRHNTNLFVAAMKR